MLFIVLSGFAGLREVSLRHLSYFDPDLRIEARYGKQINITPAIEKQLDALEGITAYSKTIEERIFIEYKRKNYLTQIKGVDSHYQNIVALDSIVDYGNWFNPKLPQAVIGYGISNALSISVYDYQNPLKLIVPKPGKGQITSVQNTYNSINVYPSGIYSVNEESDKKYVFTDIGIARALLNFDDQAFSAVELKIDPNANISTIKKQLKTLFKQPIIVKDKYELNSDLYKMLNTENIASYLIGTLIVIIALFNVVGSIIMMILDKKTHLKTLYAMGATLKQIRSIFFYQGIIMTALGSIFGIALGFLVVYLQQQFSWVMITATQPWPLLVSFQTVLIVLVTIAVLGTLASKIASSRITKSFIAN